MSGIERNKRFIWKMIFQFYKVRKTFEVDNIVRKHGMDHDDVFQLASISYLRAEKDYDPGVGVKLLTFIGHCIKGDLSRISRDFKAQKRDPASVRFLYLDDQATGDRPISELITVGDNPYQDFENKNLIASLLGELNDEEYYYIDQYYFKRKDQTQIANEVGSIQPIVCKRIKSAVRKMRQVATW